jgi:hypothetical protein
MGLTLVTVEVLLVVFGSWCAVSETWKDEDLKKSAFQL